MPRWIMTSTRRTTSMPRGVHRGRSGTWLALCAAVVLGACGSDSGAGPREEDTETSDFRFLRPGTVRDLAVESVGAGTVTLSFTETHDGLLRPALYEIRHSPTPMKNGWNTATVVSQGSCAAPFYGSRVGQGRTCTVEGLSGSGSVDFQLMAYRPWGSSAVYGQLSNIVTAEPSNLGGVSAALKVEGDNQTGIVGTELPVALAVRVKDASGNGIGGVSVSWSANRGGGSVSSATSTTDSNGIARVTRTLGTIRGENRTTAYVSGASPVEFVATAEAGPVETVTVLPAEVSLNVGDSTDMVALLEDRYGNRISGVDVTWASSDASVAPVRPNGRVLGAGSGVAGITASVDGAAAVAGGASALAAPSASAVGGSTVRVLDQVSNTPSAMTAASGAGQSGTVGQALAQPFVVEVRNSRGERVQGASVAFQVTNGGGSVSAASATTGSDGRAATTLRLGTVAGTNEVRARVDGVTPVTFSAVGVPGPVASLSVTPGSSTIQVGGTAQLVAALRDEHGNRVDGSVTWSSSAPSVVAVNSEGLVGGASVGSATIRASSGSFSGQASVTVNPATSQNPGTVADLSVSGSSSNSLTLRFTSVSDGSGGPANYQIRYAPTPLGYGWGSASLISQGTCAGVVTSTSVGQTVSCTVEGLAPGSSFDFQLVAYRGTIGAGVVFGNLSNIATGQTGASSPTTSGTLAISPRGGTLTSIGSSLQLSATARGASGATISNPGLTWSSSNTNVATVDGSGRVIARGLGSAIISVAAACCSGDQVQVTVTQQISSVSITPSSASVSAGGTLQLSAVARDANGNLIPNVMFAWSSGNSAIARVDGSGVVTGVAAGTIGVTASAGGRTGSSSVTVSGSTPPPPSGGGGTSTAWLSNLPGHMTFLTENNFPGTVTPSGWGYHQRSSEVRYASDPSKPFNGQGTGEWVYEPGMGDGVRNDPGSVYTNLTRGMRELYVAFLVRHSPGFQEQIPGTKFCHFGMSSGHNMHLDKYNPSQNWPEMYGPDAGQWVLSPTGWDGGIPHWGWNAWPQHRPGFNNVNPNAAQVDYSGGWQTVELYLRYSTNSSTSDGIVRQWVNGVLTANYTNVRFPDGNFDSATPACAGTYGGGSRTVQQRQYYRIGTIWVGRPR